jgi:hypothetical protein
MAKGKRNGTVKNLKSALRAAITFAAPTAGATKTPGHLLVTYEKEIKGIGTIEYVALIKNFCHVVTKAAGTIALKHGATGFLSMIRREIYADENSVEFFHRGLGFRLYAGKESTINLLRDTEDITVVEKNKRYGTLPVASILDGQFGGPAPVLRKKGEGKKKSEEKAASAK